MRIVVIAGSDKMGQALINPTIPLDKKRILAKKKTKNPSGVNRDEALISIGFNMGSVYAQKAIDRSIRI